MINVLQCITGFAFFGIELKENFILTTVISDCDVESDIANCSGRDFSRIPPNLGADIKILDISNNSKNFTLDKDDLKNYPNLYGFVMINQTLKGSFPEGFFKYTKQLKMLNISGSVITNFAEIPATIEVLNFTQCQLQNSFNISHLNLLQKIYLNNCQQLRQFPKISKSAPLEIVDLRGCPLSEFNYSEIAAFCHLRYFLIESPELASKKLAKQCCELREWGRMWNIQGLNHQPCFKDKDHRECSSFNVSISDESIQEYRNCYKEAEIRKFITFLVIFIIIFIILVLLATAFVYYLHKTRSKSKNRKKGSVRRESEAEASIRKGSVKGGSESEANIRKGSVKGVSETEYGTSERYGYPD